MSDWAEKNLKDEGIDAQAVKVDDDAGGEAQPGSAGRVVVAGGS